jgi:spermidine synthase
MSSLQNKGIKSFFLKEARLKVLVLSAFFLSGLSALIYQVVWMRMLTLVFGTTVFAAATVITVFMAGLAVGSYVFGRFVDKRAGSINLLRLYALIEGGIGLYCLLTPWAFSGLEVIYGYIYALSEVNFYLFSIVRFLFSSLVLFIPTVLMGATLPVISKFYVRESSVLGKDVGRLYGLNTFGAVVGVLITAFILIPVLGVKASLIFAVLVNLFIAAVTWYFSRSLSTDAGVTEVKPVRKVKREGFFTAPLSDVRLMVFAAFALSGFASLAYEVAWFRILSMTIGNTVYAFAVMLATFLFGLALGSYIVSIFIEGVKRKLRLFALIEFLIGLSAIIFTPLFGKLPLAFMSFLEYFGFDFWGLQAVNFLTAFIAIIVPTLLMGASFPVAVRILTGGLGELGGNIGRLYGLNTLGGVLGSFLAGFLLLPFIGAQTTIILMATLNICIGVVLIFKSSSTAAFKGGVSAVGVIVVVVAILLPRWDRVLLTSGVYLYGGRFLEPFKKGEFASTLKQVNKIIYYNEGVTGTTAVIDRLGNRVLSVNGKGIADIKSDPVTHTVLGSLPLMLHPAPENALLIGLGSGVTLGAMERFPLKEIETVELSAEVVEASRYFSDYNFNALEDERLNLIIDDARSYLSYTDKLYDVIVSQPSVPWMSGASNLYTTEFYETVRDSLAPGGVACQWIQVYNMDSTGLKTLMRSFQDVFPYTTMWQYKLGNVFLVGSLEPYAIPYDRLVERFAEPQVNEMMAKIGVYSPEMFIGGFVMDWEALETFTSGAPVNTYNRPLVEFAAPKSLFRSTELDNYNKISRFMPLSVPPLGGLVGRVDGAERLDFIKLESSLGARWEFSNAGFRIRNEELSVTESGRRAMISKGIMSFAQWRRNGGRKAAPPSSELESLVEGSVVKRDDATDDATMMLRIELRPGTLGIDALMRLLVRSLGEDPFAKGEAAIGGRPFLWGVSLRGSVPELSFTWHCPENGLRYVGSFMPAPTDMIEVEKVVSEVTTGLKCLPREKPF